MVEEHPITAAPITTVLVANRGEIACRVIRTVQALGLRAVAVHSDADAEAPHVKAADDAARIGPAPAAESYLDGAAVIAAARATGADAIHPGYGFLSETADFAEAVADAGLIFIGPPAAAIRAMGDKAAAKRAMIAAGVPCVPGYEEEDQADDRLLAAAADIGFPVMVKASAGGGGRGMRLVEREGDLPEALSRARAEAKSAFGSEKLIVEKAVIRPRHVEIQVFADAHGACIHLGERDCSVQRRHQKVIEESPCPVMTPDLRAAMGKAAVDAARAVDYRGAGTVEFLLDEDGAFYFLEMNTRLQVEHPVTEMVTGLDLVEWQIRVAEGATLPLAQEDVTLTGAAIEARLYAEDPAGGFLPSTGRIDLWRPATGPGVRVDAGVAEGGEALPHYDPMLAKVIAHGPDRETARRRLIAALEDTALVGPESNIAFLIDALRAEAFARGAATTAFIEETWPDGPAAPPVPDEAVALAAALALDADRGAALAAAGLIANDQLGWRSEREAVSHVALMVEGARWDLTASPRPAGWRVSIGAREVTVDLAPGFATIDGRRRIYAASAAPGGPVSLSLGVTKIRFERAAAAPGEAAASGTVAAPMPGLLIEIVAEAGAEVEAGAPLAVLEAMKMQHRITAPVSGRIRSVNAAKGAQVARGDVLVEIETEEG